jgi:hypothetical protein
MYAVVGKVSLDSGRMGEVMESLEAMVLPSVKSQEGHVASYFTRSADGSNGLSMSIFDTLEQAEASAATMVSPPEAPVTIENVEVREVIGHG